MLRGFAVLGILVMNVQGFSMPGAAYSNPTAWGDLTGINLLVWHISHLFADTKFISVFSILFGAGVCLFADRAEARVGSSAALHYRRMWWLLVFGMMHAYLLWVGDILVPYAIAGSLVYFARRWRPRTLVIVGTLLFAVASLIMLSLALSVEYMTAEQAAELKGDTWEPDPALIEAELVAYRGSWLAQMPQRLSDAIYMQVTGIPLFLFWRCAGAMLLGMALYRWGVLAAARSDAFYRRLTIGGLACGAVPVMLGTWLDFRSGWAWPSSFAYFSQFNYWGGMTMALGYIGIVMLGCRRRWMPRLQKRLAATGRMAFTNYIMQTVICTTIFYGHGIGLFGNAERWQQALVVLGVWGLQLWWSPLWLARFRMGPLEWLWRALTYGRPRRAR